jgi:large subunit ribosomal protein L15
MKLHDLRPAPGSHTARTRVGRGIAAGKGKTAGRGTKGQKARAGGSIPPWFEGGQTPLHMRIPKLRGFKNRFKTEYEVVNVGAIAAAAERGAFEGHEPEGLKAKSGKGSPPTVNQDILRAVGLVRTLSKPMKILGAGDLSTPLFVVADAFTKSAVAKIEAAGGTVSVLEVPAASRPALGTTDTPAAEPPTADEPATRTKAAAPVGEAQDAAEAPDVAEAGATAAPATKRAKTSGSTTAPRAVESTDEPEVPGDEAGDQAGDEAREGATESTSADGEDAASPLEGADATSESDAPATDIAGETDAADDGENT